MIGHGIRAALASLSYQMSELLTFDISDVYSA